MFQVEKFKKEKSAEILADQSSDKQFQFDFFFEKSLEEKAHLLLSDSDSDEEEEESAGNHS